MQQELLPSLSGFFLFVLESEINFKMNNCYCPVYRAFFFLSERGDAPLSGVIVIARYIGLFSFYLNSQSQSKNNKVIARYIGLFSFYDAVNKDIPEILELLPGISGFFLFIIRLMKDIDLDTVIARYIGLFSFYNEWNKSAANVEQGYCPVYRAFFFLYSIKYGSIKFDRVIARYIGLFSFYNLNVTELLMTAGYCPVYRAFFFLYTKHLKGSL